MDVAQALADTSPNPDEKPLESNTSPAPRPRNMMPPSAQAEKRKSSYERYSVMLPPLKEEATPDPTPASTLSRSVGNSIVQPDFDLLDLKLFNREGDNPSTPLEADEPSTSMLHFSKHAYKWKHQWIDPRF
jgi:hypothetical protein